MRCISIHALIWRSTNSLLIITQLVCPMPRSDIQIYNEIKHFYYMIYVVSPQHNISTPGVMKLTIFVDPPSPIITIYSGV